MVSGRWVSPFTGKVIQNSSEIDIDHVVPLKWAWKRGAKGWTQAKRERFANDMVNLSPVELVLIEVRVLRVRMNGCHRQASAVMWQIVLV